MDHAIGNNYGNRFVRQRYIFDFALQKFDILDAGLLLIFDSRFWKFGCRMQDLFWDLESKINNQIDWAKQSRLHCRKYI